jgi:hypothetical protein
MAARQQLEQMNQRGLPPGARSPDGSSMGQYL